MTGVNAFLARLVDGLLYPFADQPPLVGLAVVSLGLALVMLTVVRFTSNQARLIAVKRALQACVYEIRLFNDDIRTMLRAVGELARHNLTYLRLSLVPVLWMAIPIGLLVAQMHFHYGYGGLDVGHQAVVKVRMRESPNSPGSPATLVAPPGIRVETPAVWIPSLREAAWRIVADQPGTYDLTVNAGGDVFTKTIRVSNAIVRRSPLRAGTGLVDQLAYPAEAPLPESAQVESIAVTYPQQGVTLLGWEFHWMIVLFVLSAIFVLALRRTFKVVL